MRQDPDRDGGAADDDVSGRDVAGTLVRLRAGRTREPRFADRSPVFGSGWAVPGLQATTTLDPDPRRQHLPLPIFRGFPRFWPGTDTCHIRWPILGGPPVFSNGILMLAVLRSGDFGFRRFAPLHDPLYAVGVFSAFTLSQAWYGDPLAQASQPWMEVEGRDQRRRRYFNRGRPSCLAEKQADGRSMGSFSC